MYIHLCVVIHVSQCARRGSQFSLSTMSVPETEPASKYQLRISGPNSGFFPQKILIFKCVCVVEGHMSAGASGVSYRRL